MPESLCPIITVTSLADMAALERRLEGRKGAGGADAARTERAVRDILDDVRSRGLEAVVEYTRRFDCPGFAPDMFRVGEEAVDAAVRAVPEADRRILRDAVGRIRRFHAEQKEKSWFTTEADGSVLGQMVTPLDRAGLYVPGGKGGETPLISSLLMNAVPALVAGVREIAVISPPRADGGINPYILAAARELGIREIYAAGSAWGVAALAYGAGDLAPVDIIAGPGNIWVTTAKRLLLGEVGIDMLAGPSEICVIADSGADPAWLAADMLSQAEHDTLASALCIVPDGTLAEAVAAELEKQNALLPRRDVAAASLKDWGAIIVAPDTDGALSLAADIANRIAPEHLELCVPHPWDILPRIRHAGAVFMGCYAAESAGDYFAGPNHVLPTMGTARFSSALGVQTFCKRTSILALSREFARESAPAIARLARLEGLEGHARSMERRGELLGERREK